MKANRSKPYISLAISGFLFMASAQAQAQQGPVLELHYGAPDACLFQTDTGVNVSGTNAGVITATGNFTAGCQIGGGATPPAAVNLSVTPAVIQVNESATVTWSATADVCRYDGTVLPGAVAGWASMGDACVGASDCAAGGSISQPFTAGGTYNFKLTCKSGASGQQVETTDVAIASLQVNGGTPPQTACTSGPVGLTQQTIGSISKSSGANEKDNVDLTEWANSFGWDFAGSGSHSTWPQLNGGELKFNVLEDHYLSIRFQVPTGYPTYEFNGKFGSFQANDSWVDGPTWAVTISEDCGDFMPPAPTATNFKCYQNYSVSSGNLTWYVTNQPGSQAACPLKPGTTYYLNITHAPLGAPLNQFTGCQGVCKINMVHGGSY